MQVTINGKNESINENISLRDFILTMNLPQGERGIAACINLEIIPKDEWKNTPIKEGDRLDIVEAAPGG